MANDAELDRLKAAQDLAYQRKQDAYEAQQRAWERRSSAREALNSAHDAKQRAYEAQDRAWQYYQSVRNANGPSIDSLNSQQERAYESMKSMFESASSAHERRDGAAATSYAASGHGYKAEAKRLVEERRRLVDEIRSARTLHEATKPAFQRAKEDFSAAKRTFDAVKADHEQAQKTFKQAKTTFEEATAAFRARLEQVKAEHKQRKQERRDLARQAGVPAEHLDRVWVTKKPDGTVNLYFGGIGEPNGPGHAHYVLNARGELTYKRDPFDPHGSHNFTDSQRDYADRIGQESLTGEFGFICRFRGYDAFVESNTNREGRAKIDIYYGPNGPFGPGHHHTVAYREAPLEFIADNLR